MGGDGQVQGMRVRYRVRIRYRGCRSCTGGEEQIEGMRVRYRG